MEKKPSFASTSNWADDVEAEEAELGQAALPVDDLLHELPSYGQPNPRVVTSGISPPSTHSPRALHTPLPDQPPFKAYIGNVPYDVDESIIEHFFRGLKIRDVIITRHRDTGRAKGCFVEFDTQQDLANALTLNGTDLLRRSINIQVAEPKQSGGRPTVMSSSARGRSGGGSFSRFDNDDRGSSGRWTTVRDVPVVEPTTVPTERPKLFLRPRSTDAGTADATAGTEGSKPNPFGSARPANTAAKLQEIEERERQRRAEARQQPSTGGAPSVAPLPPPNTASHAKQPPGLGPPQPASGGARGGSGRDRDRRGGDSGGGSNRYRDAAAPDTLPHHRQGEGSRGGGSGRQVRGNRNTNSSKREQPSTQQHQHQHRAVPAPTDEDIPKIKLSNPFDLLNNDDA